MKKDLQVTKAALEKAAKAFYDSVDNARRIDESFSRPEDEPLTDDEIKQIDDFWEKYKFAYPNIDYKSFKTFKNRYGKFDVRHCPGAIRMQYFKKFFNNNNYLFPMQHKAMLSYIYPDINQPDVVIRQINNVLLDSDFNPITKEEAADEILRYVSEVNNGGIVIKRNMSSGGKGVSVINGEKITRELVEKELNELGYVAFVIQGFLTQSDFMAQFHTNSVNTIRVTTLIHKGKSRVLASLIRAGNGDSLVDNWCSGGVIIGVDKDTGKINNWALSNERIQINSLSNGLNLADSDLYVPNFEKIKKAVTSCHYRNPYIKMISWDIALDKNNEPTLIECNFGGMIQIHEATTGPLFGDYMEELLDEFLIQKFSVDFAEDNFICKEFNDHVTIKEYIGDDKNVVIPDTLKDKPVTKVEKNTFKGMLISSVTVSKRIADASKQSLNGIATVIKK